MATPGRYSGGTQTLRVETGRLLTPDSVASRIENMTLTEDGTLRAVNGPCPYVPPAQDGSIAYDRSHGIFHCVIEQGMREILLLHNADTIWEWQGWGGGSSAIGANGVWRRLLGGAGSYRSALIASDERPRPPTQFESTPTGVVIIPQGSKAWFYDGYEILPLGYDTRPAPPTPHAPGTTGSFDAAHGNVYLHDRSSTWAGTFALTTPGMLFHFGDCRLGFIEKYTGTDEIDGVLLPSRWRAATQWIDLWGNLSPQSGRSAEAAWGRMLTGGGEDATRYLRQIAWGDIDRGPDGTIGRIIGRTKDLEHAGTEVMWEMPNNSSEGSLAFATIPDNSCTVYPDNTPDSWLITPMLDVITFPRVTLAKKAFGVMFYAIEGKLIWSMPGRWGTVLKNDFLYPDPQGAEITAMHTVAAGLLVFTENSTFLVERNDEGTGFRSRGVSTRVGCVAPNSVKTLDGGGTVWLARDGFYTSDGTEPPSSISRDVDDLLERLNRARAVQACAVSDSFLGVYRCWIPIDSSRDNNICLEYDGTGWRRRSDVNAIDVCITQDHRRYMLACGQATTAVKADWGVWVLDHEVYSWRPLARTARVETAWFGAVRSDQKRTAYRVYLWLRETRNASLTIDVYGDWRMDAAVHSQTALCYSGEEAGEIPFWDTAAYAGTSLAGVAWKWMKRRPHWVRAEIYIPSVECFKLDIYGAFDWEFIGLEVEEVPRGAGMARVAP